MVSCRNRSSVSSLAVPCRDAQSQRSPLPLPGAGERRAASEPLGWVAKAKGPALAGPLPPEQAHGGSALPTEAGRRAGLGLSSQMAKFLSPGPNSRPLPHRDPRGLLLAAGTPAAL